MFIALLAVGMIAVAVVISVVYFLRRSHFWTEVGQHVISGSVLVRGYEDDGYND